MTPLLVQVVVAAHALATLAMTGLIWFVQVVHYPLMREVGTDAFAAYERRHLRRTTIVVCPLMLVELATAVVIVIRSSSPSIDPMLAWSGLVLLLVIWASTASLQVPCHRRLESGFDAAVHARLVRTNWLRTVAWSARSVIAVWMLIDAAHRA